MAGKTRKERVAAAVAALSIGAGYILFSGGIKGLYGHGLIDFIALIAFFVFFFFLLSARSDNDPAEHQGSRDGIAFALGKLLNRAFRPFKRGL